MSTLNALLMLPPTSSSLDDKYSADYEFTEDSVYCFESVDLNSATIEELKTSPLRVPREQPVENFEYLLSTLRNEPVEAVRHHVNHLIKKHDGKSGNEVCHILYSKRLIIEVANHVNDQLLGLIHVSREAPTTDPQSTHTGSKNPAINIRLHGSEVVESDAFCKGLTDFTTPLKATQFFFKLFCESETSSSALTELLTCMARSAALDATDYQNAPTDTELWFKPNLCVAEVGTHRLLLAVVSALLKYSVLCHDPNLVIVMRVDAFHVDFVATSFTDNDIHFVGRGNMPNCYYHVYFKGAVGGEIYTYGTIGVRCKGIFVKDFVRAILKLRLVLDDSIIVSWQELKDEAHYSILNQ